MPTYEYRCKDCEHELEVVQGFEDDPLTECPSCGGSLKKKFGSVGISFKGSGFYKNDSRSTSSSSASSTESGSSSSGSGDSATPSSKESSSTAGDGGSSTKTSSTSAAAAS